MGFSEQLRRMPVIRLVVPFILGIILQNNFQFSLSLVVPFAAATFILLSLVWRRYLPGSLYSLRWVYGFVLNFMILCLALAFTDKSIGSAFSPDYNDEEKIVMVRLLESPSGGDRSFRCLIEPLAVISGDRVTRVSGKALAWFAKDSLAGMLRVGDLVVIKGRFTGIRNRGNPFEFDYSRYMSIRGVRAQINVPAGDWFVLRRGSMNLLQFAGRLREHLLNILKNLGIEGSEYEIAGALLLGFRSGIDQDLRQSYAASGAMHILAVSGLHVGIVYILVHWLLGNFRIFRKYSAFRLMAILLVIWSYALLTGLSPSVTRASVMFSFVAFARSAQRSANVFNTLATAAFIQLTADPFTLYMVGFQLSYAAVAGIVYFQPRICSIFRFRNFLADKLWSLATVSFSAQLMIFPLIIFYFNQFPNYFLLTNLFAVPLAMMILYTGFILFIFSSIPFLSAAIAFVLNFMLLSLNFVTGAISDLPFSQTSGIVVNPPGVLILYGTILFLTAFFVRQKPRYLHYTMIFVTAGLVLKADHKISTHGRQVFIVYNSTGNSLYNFISGNNNILISPFGDENGRRPVPDVAAGPALNLNARRIKHLSAAEFFRTGSDGLSPAGSMTGRFAEFGGYRIYFACRDDPGSGVSNKPVQVDLVVISSASPASISEICSRADPAQVVIDSSVPWSARMNFVRQCAESGLTCHDVTASGAFLIGVN